MRARDVFAICVCGFAVAAAQPALVFENDQIRVFRADAGRLAGIDHGPGVVVSLDETPSSKAGAAVWLDDVAGAQAAGGTVVVRVLFSRPHGEAGKTAAPGGSKPGDAPFTGMSFQTLFENDRVTVIRARMDVGAREGFHTHGSDTLVVHLSGGEIEDTGNGKTVVNRWKHGDVEFESRGSSHSARNVGGAVDVVLVALKP
jgi:quercetin dioxygenase-like cupin family protein